MRILWLSNKALSEHDSGASGSWLDGMAQGLRRCSEVELANLTCSKVAKTMRQDCGSITQWIVPSSSTGRDGLPPAHTVREVTSLVQSFAPDLVHVWGTESFWGLLTARGLVPYPALLETQGLKRAIARVFDGGLTFRQQLACVGLKELLRRSSILDTQRRFQRWGEAETEMIRGHRFITVQSQWLRAHVQALNPTGTIFHNEFALRQPFYECAPWQPAADLVVFTSAAYPAPFKGLHVAVRAMGVLRQRFPRAKLRIAGLQPQSGIRRDGYVHWIDREVRRLAMTDSVKWLGFLPTPLLVSELQRSSAVVVPSFVEGYCLALAEAMMVGVPSVVSYVGGAANLARHEESALFFAPGDDVMCAYQLERVLSDQALARRLSQGARQTAMVRNDQGRVVQRQLDIYREVLHRWGQPSLAASTRCP